jgi:uncharacterized protein (DUF697 family)
MKKLPRAITRQPDIAGLAAVAGGGADDGAAAADPAAASRPPENGVAAPLAELVGDAGDTASDSPPVAEVLAPVPSGRAAFEAGERLFQARAIVERHATYAAVGGIIPLPLVNVAGVTTVIVRMVKMLSALYGVPFERDRARAIVVGLVAGTMPTGLGTVTASTLFYVLPASALIGLAVSSVTAVACTRSIGRIFVDHFESGATLDEFSPVQGS